MPLWIVRADNTAPVPATTTTTLPVAPTPLRPPSTSLTALPAPPDGVQFSIEDPEVIANRTKEIQDEQRANPSTQSSWEAAQEQEQSAEQSNWMLRDYTARLKKAGLASTPDTDPMAVSQTSDSSADAAAAANTANVDPLLNAPDPNKAMSPQTTPLETKTGLNSIGLNSLTSLQPLLSATPLFNSPPLNTPRDAWGEPISTAAPSSATFTTSPTIALATPPAPQGDNNQTFSSLDVPGLTAEESHMGPAADDVGFQDPLPDEPTNRQSKTEDQNNFLLPVTPTNDVSEFFKKQAEALQAPTAPTVIQPLSAPTVPVRPPEPEPTAKPVVTGLRSHVDDPFDILKQ
jgi:hypothetical protein